MKAPKTIEGISLEETWKRVTKTKTAVRESLARGQVPVANTRRALPLLKQLGDEPIAPVFPPILPSGKSGKDG